jgi:hypothetical protein
LLNKGALLDLTWSFLRQYWSPETEKNCTYCCDCDFLADNSFMDLKKLTRLFKTGKDKEKTSLYLHKPILQALDTICERTGSSKSDLVCDILDEYLAKLVEAGYLEAPTIANKDVVLNKSTKVEGA